MKNRPKIWKCIHCGCTDTNGIWIYDEQTRPMCCECYSYMSADDVGDVEDEK